MKKNNKVTDRSTKPLDMTWNRSLGAKLREPSEPNLLDAQSIILIKKKPQKIICFNNQMLSLTTDLLACGSVSLDRG